MITEYRNALSTRMGLTQAAKVFALVQEFPFRTAAELARKVNTDVISHEALHKRLPELRKRGMVRNSDPRVCTVTGKLAATWFPGVEKTRVYENNVI